MTNGRYVIETEGLTRGFGARKAVEKLNLRANARQASSKIRPGLVAAQSIVAGERKYTQIDAPILAIYALPHDMGSANSGYAAAEARDVTHITGPQANAFELGVPSARVVRFPHASHYVFQSNEKDVLREINAFVRSITQR